ncbi:hypothetical protein [Paenibacillus albus]|uniref:Uncharacterized protein n=1 Tax=Paenibacillus albus TaxID=2495582 RepID=A0A3Q8X684_9BACL|nr:hypothetical protein [Paenibacillus albus]AZN41436.1 hypothetical protein EJC50_18485 [Paenibacillus albus]
MKKYSLIRPIMLIAIALLSKSLVTNVCMLLGMEADGAKNMGFIAMIIAGIIVFRRTRRTPR